MTFDRYTGNAGRGSIVESGCLEYHFHLVGDQYIVSREYCERMRETLVGGIRGRTKNILHLVLNYLYSPVVHPATVQNLCLRHAKNLV